MTLFLDQPANGQDSYQQGLTQLQAGNYTAAISHFNQAILDDPDNGSAWHEWAYCQHMIGETEAAVSGFQVAVLYDEVASSALYNLACAMALANQTNESLDYLRQSFAAGYDNLDHLAVDSDLNNIRNLPQFQQLVNRVRTGFQQSSDQSDMDGAKQFYEAGSVFLSLEIYASAKQAFRKSVRLNKLDGSALLSLGYVHHQLGNPALALKYTNEATNYPATKSLAFYNLACFYSLKNDPSKSLDYLNQAAQSGFADLDHMSNDSELDNVRNSPRYQKIVSYISSNGNNGVGEMPRTQPNSNANSMGTVVASSEVKAMSGKEVVGVIPQGTRLQVKKQQDKWLLVEVPSTNRDGWIARSKVNAASATTSSTNNKAIANNNAMTPSNPVSTQAELEALIQKIMELGTAGRNAAAVKEIQLFMDRHESTFKQMPDAYSQVLLMAGNLYMEVQDFSNARKAIQKAANSFVPQNGKDNAQYAMMAEALGHAHVQMLDYDKAEKSFEESIAIYKKVDGAKGSTYANSIATYANYFAMRGEFDRSKSLYEQAMKILESNHGKNSLEFGGTSLNYASYFNMRGDGDKSISMLKNIVKKAKSEAPNSGLYVNAMMALANTEFLYGNFDEAESLYKKILKLQKEAVGIHSPSYYRTFLSLGSVYQAKGEFSQAESVYTQAKDLAANSSGEESFNYPMALAMLGDLYTEQGQYAEAAALQKQALEIRERVIGPKHPLTAISLQSLAGVYEKMGDNSKVEPLYLRALKIQDEVFGSKNLSSATILNSIGVFHFNNGDNKEAESYIRKSGEMFKAKLGEDSLQYAMTVQNLGELYMKKGDLKTAEEMLTQAMPIFKGSVERNYAESLHQHARLLRLKKDYAASEKSFKQSNRILDRVFGTEHPKYAEGLRQYGLLVFEQEQPEKATQIFDQYRRSVRKHTDGILPGISTDLQMTYMQEEFRPGLTTSLSLGYQMKDSPRVRALSAGWLVNGKLISQEVMAESALLTSSTGAPLVRQLRATRNQLSKLTLNMETDKVKRQRQIEQIADLESKQDDLVRQIASIGNQGDRGAWVSVGQLRESIPFGSTMINIARFAPDKIENDLTRAVHSDELTEHYVAWIIPSVASGDIQIVDLGLASEIDNLITKARKGIKDTPADLASYEDLGSEEAVNKSLSALSKLLIDPIKPYLGDSKELLISPDANLWLLPWNAFIVEDGKFLIEKFQLRYSLSGRELVAETSDRALVSPPAIIANPDFDTDKTIAKAKTTTNPINSGPTAVISRGISSVRFEGLPGTADEAKAIELPVEKFAGKKVNKMLGSDANEAAVKELHRPSALVLSTHGFFLATPSLKKDDRKALGNPLLRCGLALAGCNDKSRLGDENQEDGILTGLEIVGCDFRGTEIVVLSACETGLGEIDNGEGVAGLRQAFQLAGAEAVVASLWKVPDQDTADLMKAFWNNLAEDQDKSEAMRNAQLEMIKAIRESDDTPYPYRWAAFTLTGE